MAKSEQDESAKRDNEQIHYALCQDLVGLKYASSMILGDGTLGWMDAKCNAKILALELIVQAQAGRNSYARSVQGHSSTL